MSAPADEEGGAIGLGNWTTLSGGVWVEPSVWPSVAGEEGVEGEVSFRVGKARIAHVLYGGRVKMESIRGNTRLWLARQSVGGVE